MRLPPKCIENSKHSKIITVSRDGNSNKVSQ